MLKNEYKNRMIFFSIITPLFLLNGNLSDGLTWKSAGEITNKTALSFPAMAKEFQIICMHGAFIHVIPFSSAIASAYNGKKVISSYRGYLDGSFHDMAFSFFLGGSNIYVVLVTKDNAQISDYTCELFYR